MNSSNRRTVGFALELFRSHPRRTLVVFASYVGAGIAEGLGIAALLPILSLASREPSAAATGDETTLERLATNVLGVAGFEPTLPALLCLLVVAVSLKAVLIYVANVLAGFTTADVATTLRLRLIKALVRARWRFFTSRPIGTLANGIGVETDNSANAYSSACQTVSMGIQGIVYTFAALLISVQVTLLALGMGVLLITAFAGFVTLVRRAGARWAIATNQLTRKLVDGFTGFKALKAMGREGQLYVRLRHEVMEIRSAIRSTTRVQQLRAAIEEPALALLIAVGIYLYLAHKPVQFEALVLMVGLFYRCVTRLTLLQKHYGGVVQLEMFYRNLSEKIRAAEADAELTEGQPAPSLDAPIRFEAVTFAYDDRPVLDALSAVIRPNTLTVVFGPSGSGKSTFIDLLLGLAKPSGGRILVGDVPLNDIDLRSWRAQIGFVPQEVLLFNDTLLSNITLDDPALSRADVEASLKEAGAWSFVSALPRGLDTEVGERGSMLSGGQRQRIALARALVRRPSLLILDEATSALDPEIERAIWEELKVLTRRHTIVAVTHQPRVLGLADAVLGLENGRAIATPFPRRAVESKA